ncbi:hypothetical protein D3C84_557460 [compost metagenome]
MDAARTGVIQADPRVGACGQALALQQNRQGDTAHTHPIQRHGSGAGLSGDIREGDGVHRHLLK